MSATTTQLLSSGEFCELRYDTIPVKSASANVSFYTSNSKNAKFLSCDTLVANDRYVIKGAVMAHFLNNVAIQKSFILMLGVLTVFGVFGSLLALCIL